MYVTKMAYSRGVISSVVDRNNTRKEKKSLKMTMTVKHTYTYHCYPFN